MEITYTKREHRFEDVEVTINIPTEPKYYFFHRTAYAVVPFESVDPEHPEWGQIKIMSVDCDSFSEHEIKSFKIPFNRVVEIMNADHWSSNVLKMFIEDENSDRTKEQFNSDLEATLKRHRTFFDDRY